MEAVPLVGLGPIVQQGDPGIGDAKNLTGIKPAQLGKLHQVTFLGLGIGSRIQIDEAGRLGRIG